MTGHIIKNFRNIKAQLKEISPDTNISIVTKNRDIELIEELLKYGHVDFAENKVQEAVRKWVYLKAKYSNINLHLIGKLQNNKIKQALEIFDVIETIDNHKLAYKLNDMMLKMNKFPKCFIQVNIGSEPQKGGVALSEVNEFINKIKIETTIPLQGLMCIPPKGVNPEEYFILLKSIAKEHNLDYLSMGMSNDFKLAATYGATNVRIGSAIFDHIG